MEYMQSHEAIVAAHAHRGRGAGRVDAGLTVSALIREGAPEGRAASAERRLLRTVGEWEPGSGLDIVIASAARGDRITVDVRSIGAAPSAWHDDVRSALAQIADLSVAGGARRARATPAVLAELVRDPARSQLPLDDDSVRPADVQHLRAPVISWPVAMRQPGDDVLSAVRGVRGGFVRILIAATTDLERAMVDDELRAGWDRVANPSFDAYFGVPVRIRAFVGVTGDATGYAGLRATVRGWGSALVLRDADAAAREDFWTMGAVDLAGHVRPEGWALAAMRLPAAGERAPLGVASRPRPVAHRPIDLRPTREPGTVAIGRARTSAGGIRPVTISRSDLCRHIFVEGRSGAGKTTFAVALAHQLSRQGIGFTLIEHHGSGVDQALRALAPDQAARAHVVRHGDVQAPGSISLFSDPDEAVREQTISEFIDLIQRIFDPKAEGIVGPRWRRWFSLLCDGVAAFWGEQATLLHVLAVASDPDLAKKLAVKLLSRDRDLAHRIHREIGALRGDEAANMPAWAISKFQPLVGSKIMREIVGRPLDSVDVGRAMDEGRPLLIDLGGPVVGTPSARMLGALWLMKHWVAMGRRADRTKPHVIIVDEAHLMTVGALPAMLAEARKFGIGVVILSQSIDALAPDLQMAIEANVGTHLSFRLGLNTVGRASLRLDGWDPRELVRLPDLTAATTLARDGVQSDPFLLQVRRPPIDGPEAFAQARKLDTRRVERMRPDLAAIVTDRAVEAALEPRPERMPAPRATADASVAGDLDEVSTDTRPVPVVSARASALDEWLARKREAAAAGSGEPIPN